MIAFETLISCADKFIENIPEEDKRNLREVTLIIRTKNNTYVDTQLDWENTENYGLETFSADFYTQDAILICKSKTCKVPTMYFVPFEEISLLQFMYTVNYSVDDNSKK